MLSSVQTLQKDTHAVQRTNITKRYSGCALRTAQCTNITKRYSCGAVYKYYKKIVLCTNMTTLGHSGVSRMYFKDKCFLCI